MSPPARRPLFLKCESLEDRVTPSWSSVPPATVPVPAGAIALALNANGDIEGGASVSRSEVDWYKVTVAAGDTTFTARTPSSALNTVIGVYDSAGNRVAFNDDSSKEDTDSRVGVTLAGGTYFFGVTNVAGTPNGRYTYGVNAPTPATAPTDGYQITLRTNGLTSAQKAVFERAAARWQSVIVGDVPDTTYNGAAVDDILIDATAVSIDGVGGVLGSAGPDRVRPGSLLPVHGTMRFDSTDLLRLEGSGQLFSTVLHEMGHVLGVGTVWAARGLLSNSGSADPRFTGPRAVRAYNQMTGGSATSVPVENTGGPGTANAHWRETALGDELMTGYLGTGSNPLSRLTVASLGDIGYVVNEAAGDPFTASGGPAVTPGGTGGVDVSAPSGGGNLVQPGTGCGCDLCASFVRPTMEVAADQRVWGPTLIPYAPRVAPLAPRVAAPTGERRATLTPARDQTDAMPARRVTELVVRTPARQVRPAAVVSDDTRA